MLRGIVLLVGAVAFVCTASLPAQDITLGQKYGQGIHAFFAGDYVKAYEQLSVAIEGGSNDPRAYYFRGLAYLRLGRPQEAAMDFQRGAELESKDVNKFYNVAKALERVQGAGRVELENHRVNARMAALEEAEKLRKARYQAIEQEEARLVREQTTLTTKIAAPAGETPVDVISPPATEPTQTDPFAEEPARKQPDRRTVEAGKKPAKPVEPPAEPATSQPEDGSDPFATEPKTSDKVEPVERAKPTSDDDDPFASETKPAPAAKSSSAAKSAPKSAPAEQPQPLPKAKKVIRPDKEPKER